MDLVPQASNVVLRGGDVVFSFPYDATLVDVMRAMPGRRFDWEAKEWKVPALDEAAPYVRDVLERWPELLVDDGVHAWLGGTSAARWVARVTTRRHKGEPAFMVRVVAGALPEPLAAAVVDEPLGDGRLFAIPFREEVAEALLEDAGVHLDRGADGCAQRLRVGLDPPPARLVV